MRRITAFDWVVLSGRGYAQWRCDTHSANEREAADLIPQTLPPSTLARREVRWEV